MHECRCDCCAHPANENYHVASYEIDDGDARRVVWHFPLEPKWWRDSDAGEQRQQVLRKYEPNDLVTLIDEVAMYVNDPPTNAIEAAQLIRRLLSLSWIADVCIGSLDFLPEDAQLDYWTRYWQQRAGRYLVEAARRMMTGLSINVDEVMANAGCCEQIDIVG